MTDDMKLTDAEHASMAERLHDAILSGRGIDPPSESIDFTLADAYRVRRKLVDRLVESAPGRALVFRKARQGVMEKTRGLYPAPLSILDCVRTGYSKGFRAGSKREAELFGKLVVEAFANNGDFVLNALEQMVGGVALADLRGRGISWRPFERIIALENEANPLGA